MDWLKCRYIGVIKKPVLDVCCGSRMWWFNKENPDVLYMDYRKETCIYKDKTAKTGLRKVVIAPDILGDFTASAIGLRLVFGALIWPLGEEILFRGYLFGQLVRRGGIDLWVAAITTGLIFGLLHLGQAAVQSLPLSGEIGTVALVSIGGIFYAWLFAKWNYNLWVPIGMHLFMNLWWSVFDMADSPLGGWLPNVLRLATVVLAIVFTIYRERWPVSA